jgi:adenylate kinase
VEYYFLVVCFVEKCRWLFYGGILMALYLVIMGVQGCGKGTQAAFISEEFGIPHVSTGDLFRAMKTRTDELAQRVQDIINSGILVPDDVTNEVLKDRLEQDDAANGVILDGYPRNVEQAKWLGEYLESKGKELNAVLLLDLDFYTAFKRAFGRVKAADGTQYNIFTNNEGLEWAAEDHPNGDYPPRLIVTNKETGEKLERRIDDEAFSVIKRIETYRQSTAPLIGYYGENGRTLSFDASQSIDEVGKAIKKAIDEIK